MELRKSAWSCLTDKNIEGKTPFSPAFSRMHGKENNSDQTFFLPLGASVNEKKKCIGEAINLLYSASVWVNTIQHSTNIGLFSWDESIFFLHICLLRLRFFTSFSTSSLVPFLQWCEGVCMGLWHCVPSSTRPYTDWAVRGEVEEVMEGENVHLLFGVDKACKQLPGRPQCCKIRGI